MPSPPIVVIGGSAGALEPLLEIAAHLPGDFPAPVAVVIHLSPDHPSHLPEILDRAGPLSARQARHDEVLRPGCIHVAPPDHHLLIAHDRVRLSRGPRENRSRPSVDVLFRSAAYTHGSGVIGVLLSGMLDDGTSGLWAIEQLGGTVVVQHPEQAEFSSMPLSALQRVKVDHILPALEIARRLPQLTGAARRKGGRHMSDQQRRRLEFEVNAASENNITLDEFLEYGELSPFTCPECHGVMVSIREGQETRFRCHTGHAFSADSLRSAVRDSVELSLWSAVRALDERAMLLEHLAKHSEEADQHEQMRAYREEVQETLAQARDLRRHAARVNPVAPRDAERPT